MIDEDLKKISKVIDDKFEEKFIKLFNQGFEEVVIPRLDDMSEEMAKGFKQVNSKLDYVNQRLDNNATQLDEHEKRISKLEHSRLVD